MVGQTFTNVLRRDPRQISFFGPEHEKELQKPVDTVPWVRQEHKYSCVLASVAMVLGKSYTETHSLLAPKIWHSIKTENTFKWVRGVDFDQTGWFSSDAYRWLEEHGFATQIKHEVRWGHVKRYPWPPKPFAPVHMVLVTTHNGTGHSIIMTGEGKLLDPSLEPGTWSEDWSYYQSVREVCGVWKVGKFRMHK